MRTPLGIIASSRPNSVATVPITEQFAAAGWASSGDYNSAFLASFAGDGYILNTNRWAGSDGLIPAWLRRDESTAKVATWYSVSHPLNANQVPTAWTFQGSNDPTFASWDTLDTRSGVTWADFGTKTYTFTNVTAYRWYRIRITAIAAGSIPSIGELRVGKGTPPSRPYRDLQNALTQGGAWTIGTVFQPQVNGYITHIRIAKPGAATGVATVYLWNSARTVLASATVDFATITADGSYEVPITPTPVTAGTNYMAGEYSPSGIGDLTGAISSDIVEGDIKILASGSATFDGATSNPRHVSGSGFPTTSWSGRWLVEPVFVRNLIALDDIPKKLWLKPSSLGAAGTLAAWADSSSENRALVIPAGAPTIETASTPGGGKAVVFAGAGGLNYPPASATTQRSSSAYNSSYVAEMAADGSDGTYWHSGPATSFPQWWDTTTGGTPRLLTQAKIKCMAGTNSGPAAFTVQGSMDGTSFTDLQSFSGLSWATGEEKTFDFANSVAWNYYRLNFTAGTGDNYLRLSAITWTGLTYITSATYQTRDGEVWSLLKWAGSGNNNGAWWLGASGQSSHYLYGGVVYEDAGITGRVSYGPLLDTSAWRTYRVSVAQANFKAYMSGGPLYSLDGIVRSWPDLLRIGTSLNGPWAGRMAAFMALDHRADHFEAGVIAAWFASL